MSEHFGPAAFALFGIAARLLGWRPNEFWSATPAELAAALAPPGASAAGGIDRGQLMRMMEKDDGEPGN
jgi:hypothetical protein